MNMPKRQSGHIYHPIEAVIEIDIEDFPNATPVMVILEITEYIKSIITKMKQNNLTNII